MKIKYKVLIVALILVCSFLTVYAYIPSIGTMIGEVLYTDIVTKIDGKEIPSVNIGGRTAIIVEDLKDYGYDVTWNGDERRLDVNTNENKPSSDKAITGMVMLPNGMKAKEDIHVQVGVMMENNIPDGASGVPARTTKYTNIIIYKGNNFATYSLQLSKMPNYYQLEFVTIYNGNKYVDHKTVKNGDREENNYVLNIK